jgi:LysR family transcriptional regulator for bpeEF and oprC
MPVSFGRIKVVPLLGAFQARYPDIELVLTFRDRIIDLVEEGVDLAFRFGPLPDSSLIARRFAETRFQVVASPAYLAQVGRPRTIEDLKRHACLVLRQREGRPRPWRFRRGAREILLAPPSRMSFSDGAAICAAASAGYGLAQMHDYYTDGPIAAGELEPVLERFRAGSDVISLVYPQTRHLSPKVRAFIDFMTTD